MLVSLTVQNWKSFKNETLFTMMSTKERKDSVSLAKLPPMYNSRKILPVAAVYGANASGKTTIMEALSLLKRLVVFGLQVDQAIPVEGYRLDPALFRKPSRFTVEFLRSDLIYRYDITLSRAFVEREVLSINSDYALRRLKEAAGRFSLAALTNDVRHVAEYEEGLYERMAAQHSDVLEEIRTTGQLSSETEAKLKLALEAYTRDFLKNK